MTVRYVAWYIERWPHKRVVIAAYNQFLANKFSRKVRKIISRRIALSSERNAVEDWETIYGGGLRVVGVGAGITGQGADLIVIDDPVKNREEAESFTLREKVWDWFTDDLYTRLEPGGQMIVIMTRWHYDDLGGRIQKMPEWKSDWVHVNLPALAKENDPLGRAVGEALNPERYSTEDLERIRLVLRRNFTALFQQDPSPPEGSIIKLGWFKRYRTLPADKPLRIVQSWDCAAKAKELSSYWVCTTWFEYAHGYFLVDMYREQVEYPDGKKATYEQATRWNASMVLIEDKASGQALLQEIRYNNVNQHKVQPPYNVKMNVRAIEPEGDKIMRASVSSDVIEAGYVYVPESAPWIAPFEEEVLTFPLGSTNDIIDSMSQYLRWVGQKIVAAFSDRAAEEERKQETVKQPCSCGHSFVEHQQVEGGPCDVCNCLTYKETTPLWTWQAVKANMTGKIPMRTPSRPKLPPRRR